MLKLPFGNENYRMVARHIILFARKNDHHGHRTFALKFGGTRDIPRRKGYSLLWPMREGSARRGIFIRAKLFKAGLR